MIVVELGVNLDKQGGQGGNEFEEEKMKKDSKTRTEGLIGSGWKGM